MSILDHPAWPELAPHVRIETYDRDGGHAHPRHRIEIYAPDLPTALRWIALESRCVQCGELMHPIRPRAARNSRGVRARKLYYAATCPLIVRMGCARGSAAALEYERIVRTMGGQI